MRFVIVTGMSGAGKSTALKMLEDVGYFCVDNLPIPVIPAPVSYTHLLSYREDYQQKEKLYSKQIEMLEEKKKENVTEDVFATPWLRRLLELKDIEAVSYTHLDVYKRQALYWEH